MKILRKTIVSLLVFLFAISTLLSATIFITPWLIHNTSVGSKIRGEASKLVSGEFDFKQIDLEILPRPHLVLTNPEINLPQHV